MYCGTPSGAMLLGTRCPGTSTTESYMLSKSQVVLLFAVVGSLLHPALVPRATAAVAMSSPSRTSTDTSHPYRHARSQRAGEPDSERRKARVWSAVRRQSLPQERLGGGHPAARAGAVVVAPRAAEQCVGQHVRHLEARGDRRRAQGGLQDRARPGAAVCPEWAAQDPPDEGPVRQFLRQTRQRDL